MAYILVVDDEEKMARLVAGTLEDAGHHLTITSSGKDACASLANHNFDLLITDLKMDPPDGLELLEIVKDKYKDTGVILMTAYASAESAVTAMKKGAYDYLIKPFALDELVILVERYLENQKSKNLTKQLQIDYKNLAIGEFIGQSAPVKKLFGFIEKVARRDATILLTGESGTGKELIANMIHDQSQHADAPFIALNCAALSETLLESELFGHEKGAFTGAYKRKPGRFELADGGTLFLDEIGEISTAMQVKLLRVLELKNFMRVGGTETITSDVRIIAATNRDLKAEMQNNRFREDLYFRLAVFPIAIPPLRERVDDIPQITDYFLKRLGYKYDQLTEDVINILKSYPFPGNVRELKNIIERAFILADDEEITPDLLGIDISDETTAPQSGGLNELEKNAIVDSLNKNNGNKTKAAADLQITRRRLYSRMKIYNIKSDPDGTFI